MRSSTPSTSTRSRNANPPPTPELGGNTAMTVLESSSMSKIATLDDVTTILRDSKLWNLCPNESWATAASEFERALMQLSIYSPVHITDATMGVGLRDGLRALMAVFRHLITKPTLTAGGIPATAEALVEAIASRIPTPMSIDKEIILTLQQRLSAFEVKFGELTQKPDTKIATSPTYIDAARQPRAPTDCFEGQMHAEQDAIMHSDLHDRRILITADTEFTNEWLNTDPARLILKANIVIGKIVEGNGLCDGLATIKDAEATDALHTGKSGVIYGFASKAAAEWLKQADNMDIFRLHFDAGA